MIDLLTRLLEDGEDLSRFIDQLGCQIEKLQRENESRMERYDRVKSKIDRLNSIKSLLAYMENPNNGELSSDHANEFLEKMIKAGYR